jgi:hypothetical protein
MIVCIKDILLLINIEHVINIHKEKDLDNVLSVPLKTKTNKEFMEAREPCMHEEISRDGKETCGVCIQISLINKPSMVFHEDIFTENAI